MLMSDVRAEEFAVFLSLSTHSSSSSLSTLCP